jgi:hypothetical protein
MHEKAYCTQLELDTSDAITLLYEALDAHRGQNVDAWFWKNINRVNAILQHHKRKYMSVEYKLFVLGHVGYKSNALLIELNKLGAEGWTMVGGTLQEHDYNVGWTAIFFKHITKQAEHKQETNCRTCNSPGALSVGSRCLPCVQFSEWQSSL